MGGSDPRARRDADGLISDDFLGDGVELDGEGRLRARINPDSALAVTPDGSLTIRVAGILEQSAASPVALRVRPEAVRQTVKPDLTLVSDALVARLVAAEARVATLESSLADAEQALSDAQDARAALDARVTALEGG